MSSVCLSPPEKHLSMSILTSWPSHLEPIDKYLQVTLQFLISCFHYLYLATLQMGKCFHIIPKYQELIT